MRVAALALAAVVALPVSAGAQCAFDRPKGSSSSTAYLVSSLVRAFVSCNNPGGNPVNATTVTGTVPTCYPVENFHERDGSPSGGWQFHTGSSYGKVYIKRTSGGPNLNLPPTNLDAAITVKLYKIDRTDSGGGFANGTGTVQVVLRATTNDFGGRDMTVVDFPFGFPITLHGGSASVTKKIGDILLGMNQPRFSDCTSLEIVSIAVRDPNGNVFAVPGVRH